MSTDLRRSHPSSRSSIALMSRTGQRFYW